MSEKLKVFALDTNILIQDPYAFMRFDEHAVLIPMTVLEELDAIKSEQSDRGRQARLANRLISDSIIEDELPKRQISRSGELLMTVLQVNRETIGESPATLYFATLKAVEGKPLPLSPDDRIIRTLECGHDHPYLDDQSTQLHLVTNDNNVRIKAIAQKINTQTYHNQEAFSDSKAMTSGSICFSAPEEFWDLAVSPTSTQQSASGCGGMRLEFQVSAEQASLFHPQQLIVFKDQSPSLIISSMDERSEGTVLQVKEAAKQAGWQGLEKIKPKDDRQAFALAAIASKDIDLITLAGNAGTGKTLLALAGAFHLIETGQCQRIIASRETLEMGEKIGFLKGSEEEKMGPWMGAIEDNVRLLSELNEETFEDRMKRIHLKSIGFMRGRSLIDTVLILDESQNLTLKQAKNLISRAGEGTKVICLGNVAQVDHPYLNPGSTGLAHIVKNFADWPHAAHITLESVYRSRLAGAAEERL